MNFYTKFQEFKRNNKYYDLHLNITIDDKITFIKCHKAIVCEQSSLIAILNDKHPDDNMIKLAIPEGVSVQDLSDAIDYLYVDDHEDDLVTSNNILKCLIYIGVPIKIITKYIFAIHRNSANTADALKVLIEHFSSKEDNETLLSPEVENLICYYAPEVENSIVIPEYMDYFGKSLKNSSYQIGNEFFYEKKRRRTQDSIMHKTCKIIDENEIFIEDFYESDCVEFEAFNNTWIVSIYPSVDDIKCLEIGRRNYIYTQDLIGDAYHIVITIYYEDNKSQTELTKDAPLWKFSTEIDSAHVIRMRINMYILKNIAK